MISPPEPSPATIDLGECSACPDLGRCCYFQAVINDVAVYSSHSCPFLKGGLCSVYETRFDVAPWCGKLTNPKIKWPTFCPHHSAWGMDVMSVEEFYSIHGVNPQDPAGLAVLKDHIDVTVEEQVRDEFGLDLRSFEEKTEPGQEKPPHQ